MEQQQPSRRGRKASKPPHEVATNQSPPPEVVTPEAKDDGLPPGTYRKLLPSGSYLIIKDNFIRR